MTHVLYLTEEAIRFEEPMVRGGAIHVRNVVTGLRQRGHNVTLIDWNDTPDRPSQRSVTPYSRLFGGAARSAWAAATAGHDMDAEVVVSKTRKTYLPGLLAARMLGIPHVAHVGSSLSPLPGLTNWASAKSFALRLRAPHDSYFVVCNSIRNELRQHGVTGTIYNVRNAVDTDQFTPKPAHKESLNQFHDCHKDSISGSDLTLGFVGGLYEYKGLFDLVAAMDRCSERVSLLVAGTGPIQEELKARLGDRATFLGAVPYEDIPHVYRSSDVFVLPSHTEGLPRVVLEAQSTATPVIATRVGGVPEVVTTDETGILCPPRSPDDLSMAIDRLADTDKRERLGKNGRAAVLDQFSWEALYDRYEQYLSEVVSETSAPRTEDR